MSVQPDEGKKERKIKLAETVVSLQGAHPQMWDVFMALLASRLEDIRQACIHSPADQIVQRQGRALEAEDFFREIYGARSLVDEMYAKGTRK